jgi:hypothetical protein
MWHEPYLQSHGPFVTLLFTLISILEAVELTIDRSTNVHGIVDSVNARIGEIPQFFA